ncbi:hypothetical protein N8550_02720, partial [Pirellulaceae bacterium]|nr:hypothetical protein [Pirellulaceae bacterium]
SLLWCLSKPWNCDADVRLSKMLIVNLGSPDVARLEWRRCSKPHNASAIPGVDPDETMIRSIRK